MTANPFRIVPLETAVAEEARHRVEAGAANHKITTVDAPNTAPCRHCLRWAAPGESMILFPYQSISADRPYGERGPVFVHHNRCEQYSAVHEYPTAFQRGRVIRGYNADDEIIAAEVADPDPEAVIHALLGSPEIEFLHVRSVTRGCYTMKVERA